MAAQNIMSKRGRGEPQELRDCGVRTSWVREWSPWGVNVAWPMVPSGLAELETAHRGAMDEVNRLKRKLPSPSDLKPVKIWPSSKSRLPMIEISLNNKTESKSCRTQREPTVNSQHPVARSSVESQRTKSWAALPRVELESLQMISNPLLP